MRDLVGDVALEPEEPRQFVVPLEWRRESVRERAQKRKREQKKRGIPRLQEEVEEEGEIFSWLLVSAPFHSPFSRSSSLFFLPLLSKEQDFFLC